MHHTRQSILKIIENSAPRSRKRVVAKAILKWMDRNRKIEIKTIELTPKDDIEFPTTKWRKDHIIREKVSNLRNLKLAIQQLTP